MTTKEAKLKFQEKWMKASTKDGSVVALNLTRRVRDTMEVNGWSTTILGLVTPWGSHKLRCAFGLTDIKRLYALHGNMHL